MGALFVVSTRDARFAERAIRSARALFAAQQFGDVRELRLPGWSVLHAGYALGGPELCLERPDGLAAVAGTMTVAGRLGAPALARLVAGHGAPDAERDELGGQFAAVVRRGGRTFLVGDWFAALPIYHDRERRVFSTSFLAAAAALPHRSLDRQAVYEFAFNIVPVGNDTLVEQLSLLAPGEGVELGPDGAMPFRRPRVLDATPSPEPAAAQVGRLCAALDAVVRAHGDAASHGVRCPLSGGIDSRLAFAAARRAGLAPALYVYGPPGSVDVRIARGIAAAEGLPIACIDLHGAAPDPATFAGQVERNFHLSDGPPNFGNIFDAGSNAAAREARHAGGALAISGGCGEVMRDFFLLPDRPVSAHRVARSFLSRFSPLEASGEFDGRLFVAAVSAKLAEAVGVDDPRRPLPRLLIEQLYPRVRCRSLFGREIAVEARHGPYLMPFLDHRFVAEAMRLPMALRWAGRAEAMLLAAVDARLAAYPSAYGHSFAGPPSRRHRLAEWSSRARPAWLRERAYRLRRRFGAVGDEHGGLPAIDLLGQVIDPSLPHMRAFFRPEHIRDPALWRRVACLEYLAGWLARSPAVALAA